MVIFTTIKRALRYIIFLLSLRMRNKGTGDVRTNVVTNDNTENVKVPVYNKIKKILLHNKRRAFVP